MKAVGETCRQIANLVQNGTRIVVTHGNGPQVGFLLIRSHLARNRLPEIPLDAANALTQAEIGYMIQQSLGNEFAARGFTTKVATVLTQVVVDRDDPAFKNPSKPVGPFYTKAEGTRLQNELGWVMREDAGRGFRRMVASPRPVEIVEGEQIQELTESGTTVIACGGGGIPVVRQDGGLKGVAAVIDKDLASSLLARSIGAGKLVITTAVEQVFVSFGKPGQRPLGQVSAPELARYLEAGEFPEGSMGPKVQAALDFLKNGGKEVIITDPEHLSAAFDRPSRASSTEGRFGRAGTRIVP